MPVPCLASVASFDREARALWGRDEGVEADDSVEDGGGVARCFQCLPRSIWKPQDNVAVENKGGIVSKEGQDEEEEGNEPYRWREENRTQNMKAKSKEKSEENNEFENGSTKARSSNFGAGGRDDKENGKGRENGNGKTHSRNGSRHEDDPGHERQDGDNFGDDDDGRSSRVRIKDIISAGDKGSFRWRETSEFSKDRAEGEGGTGAVLATGIAAALFGAVLSSVASTTAEIVVGSDSGGDGGANHSIEQGLRGTQKKGGRDNDTLLGLDSSSASRRASAADSKILSPRLRGTGKQTAAPPPPFSKGEGIQAATDYSPLYGIRDRGRLAPDARGGISGGGGSARDVRSSDGWEMVFGGADIDGWAVGGRQAGGASGRDVRVAGDILTLKPASSLHEGSMHDCREGMRPAAERALQVSRRWRMYGGDSQLLTI